MTSFALSLMNVPGGKALVKMSANCSVVLQYFSFTDFCFIWSPSMLYRILASLVGDLLSTYIAVGSSCQWLNSSRRFGKFFVGSIYLLFKVQLLFFITKFIFQWIQRTIYHSCEHTLKSTLTIKWNVWEISGNSVTWCLVGIWIEVEWVEWRL